MPVIFHSYCMNIQFNPSLRDKSTWKSYLKNPFADAYSPLLKGNLTMVPTYLLTGACKHSPCVLLLLGRLHPAPETPQVSSGKPYLDWDPEVSHYLSPIHFVSHSFPKRYAAPIEPHVRSSEPKIGCLLKFSEWPIAKEHVEDNGLLENAAYLHLVRGSRMECARWDPSIEGVENHSTWDCTDPNKGLISLGYFAWGKRDLMHPLKHSPDLRWFHVS